MMVPEQITETIEHPFQRLFRRACCFLYPESFKWFQCNRGFERGHMSLSILFTQDDVAGERQSDIDIPLQCLMRKFRIARAEDLVRRMIHPELLFEFCLNIDLGDDAEFLFQKGFAHPCLCFFQRERESRFEAVGGGWHMKNRESKYYCIMPGRLPASSIISRIISSISSCSSCPSPDIPSS